MSAILAMCLSSQLIQGQTNLWLYQRVTLSMAKPREILSFTSGLTHRRACHILSLTILPRDRVAEDLPSGTLEHLMSRLSSLHTFK